MKVTPMSITENSEHLISRAYGICTGKQAISVENIQKWIKLGHESPLEHASATFLIEDISRSCLAQLTRHRIASYSVQSMRYCDVGENPSVVPLSLLEESITHVEPNLLTDYLGVMDYARDVYNHLVEMGIPKEDARFVLPLATTTDLIMTMNFRELRHFFVLRTHKAAQWEIRKLANMILDVMIGEAPNVFSDLREGE